MKFDKYEMSPHGIAQLRFVKTDGTYHRQTRVPTDHISDLPEIIQGEILKIWTPEFIDAWAESQSQITLL